MWGPPDHRGLGVFVWLPRSGAVRGGIRRPAHLVHQLQHVTLAARAVPAAHVDPGRRPWPWWSLADLVLAVPGRAQRPGTGCAPPPGQAGAPGAPAAARHPRGPGGPSCACGSRAAPAGVEGVARSTSAGGPGQFLRAAWCPAAAQQPPVPGGASIRIQDRSPWPWWSPARPGDGRRRRAWPARPQQVGPGNSFGPPGAQLQRFPSRTWRRSGSMTAEPGGRGGHGPSCAPPSGPGRSAWCFSSALQLLQHAGPIRPELPNHQGFLIPGRVLQDCN